MTAKEKNKFFSLHLIAKCKYLLLCKKCFASHIIFFYIQYNTLEAYVMKMSRCSIKCELHKTAQAKVSVLENEWKDSGAEVFLTM